MSKKNLDSHVFTVRKRIGRRAGGKPVMGNVHSHNCWNCGLEYEYAKRVKCPVKKSERREVEA
jgi:predicted Zn-ribbon and HTH transcriptional regulator